MQQRLAVVWRYQVVLAVLVVTCHCAAALVPLMPVVLSLSWHLQVCLAPLSKSLQALALVDRVARCS